MAGSRVLGIPAHVGGIGPPLGPGGHRDRQAVSGRRSRCDDRHSGWCSGWCSNRCCGRLGDRPGARGQRHGGRIHLSALVLHGGGILDDGGRCSLGGLEVVCTEDLLALRAGGDQGQLEPGGKRAADDGGLDRVGPAGDELPRAGGGAVVAAGVGRLAQIPGRPAPALPHAQVDAHAFGQVGAAGPGEAGDEEAVDLEGVGEQGGVRLRIRGRRQDRRDRRVGCARGLSEGGHGGGCTEHRRRAHRGGVIGATGLLGRWPWRLGARPIARPRAGALPRRGLDVVEPRLRHLGGLPASGGQVEDLHRSGGLALTTGVAGAWSGTGHGDQAGQEQRGQGDEPGGAARACAGAETTGMATEAMAAARSDAAKSARDVHGVPLR